jgi:GAF domain-containing protein
MAHGRSFPPCVVVFWGLSMFDEFDVHPRLLDALASLNEIGATINRLGPRDGLGIEMTLRLIVESALKVLPGSSAVIYTYDARTQRFDPGSRVLAGPRVDPLSELGPRPDGVGARAIAGRRRVISYEEGDLEIPSLATPGGPCVLVCWPLIVADEPVGALYLYRHEDRLFSRLELLMLDNFVNQAAMAIFHAQRLAVIQRDLTRKEDELSRLRRAGLLISSRSRLKETLEAILQMALEVTGARYGIFRLVDAEGRRLITGAVAGDELIRPLVEDLPIAPTSVMGTVALQRQRVRISDLREDPWRSVYYPLDSELEMRSELAVPLINASGRLEGVLNLESPIVGAFSEDDSLLLQALATQAVIAIQEMRLLDALQDVAGRLLAQPRQDVLGHLADLACHLLNAVAGAIWLPEGDELVALAVGGAHPIGERVPLVGSLAGEAVRGRGPVTADDVQSDARFHRRALARDRGWSRALVVPVLAGDEAEPVGAFSVYSAGSEPGRFADSEWDKKVLTVLAHYAALAVRNADRQEALRAAQEQRAVAETFAAVGDVAANLLHQLNNKVGAIPVRVQGIQDKCAGALAADPYLASNLAEIERSAGEAMEAVRENVFHLRPIRLVPVEVGACVTAAVRSSHLPPAVTVRVANLDDLPPVIGAERSLMWVFANLIDNAVDAMGGRGQIAFQGARRGDPARTAAGPGVVEIAVSDTGPGIAPALHGRIFDLDFSGRAAPRPGKLGFGLWWVKTLMTRLGGSVIVESDGAHGTTFRLRLPAASVAADQRGAAKRG